MVSFLGIASDKTSGVHRIIEFLWFGKTFNILESLSFFVFSLSEQLLGSEWSARSSLLELLTLSSEHSWELASLMILPWDLLASSFPLNAQVPTALGSKQQLLKLQLHRLIEPKQNWDRKRGEKSSRCWLNSLGVQEISLGLFSRVPVLAQGGAASPPARAGTTVPSPKRLCCTKSQLLILLKVQNALHGDPLRSGCLFFSCSFPASMGGRPRCYRRVMDSTFSCLRWAWRGRWVCC